ncbi:enoyl-CoA hydratase-related protein [Aestuariirhabdus litorea]|uniref:Enoyl-CoA hydratase n=1 Tax=Aestuariirhabdus litorea TaxID=2528527 RepID=A0A3P3VI57_9GAMM|nr:enoyl-CoA hydratase-related protein [Aestuariirhabdus litorea]RRJ82410.1 enoyl-CoA hydratase [Aestuariirhabdus litorea]RWW92573.1 enoyl-CoA hydratase [Endozoicomonadaceae bacterium GTF-13]
MSEYQFILSERINNVGVITLNRPEQLNAINELVTQELVDALSAFDRDDRIGAIVLTGNRQCFAAGADLKHIAQLEFADAYRSDFAAPIDQVAAIRKPIIAAVSGIAFGAGTEIALMCDIILASQSARFGLPEVTLGVIPGAGGTQRLSDRIGKAKAMYYILTGRPFNASEAEQMGLISQIMPDDTLLDEAIKLATTIANNPRLAVLAGKETVNQVAEITLAQGLQLERRLFHGLFGTADQKEGMAAFGEKRKPNYTTYE